MVIEIDFAGNEAIYLQLRNQIIWQIATSRLREGDILPGVRQMADSIGINMHTVSKAYTLLREEGYVRTQQGVGTVVAMDINQMKAKEQIKEKLRLLLASAYCQRLSRYEIHEMIDEIYNEY